MASLVAGATAYIGLEHSVTVSVDGHAHHVHGFGRTVGAMLAQAGIPVGPHDTVWPSASSPVHDGETVLVRYGRPLRLTVDGRTSTVWTTAVSVSGALDQFGLRAEGAYVSVSRSMPIGRTGLAVTVRLPVPVTVLADGKRYVLSTSSPTVGGVLAQLGITLRAADTVSAPLSAAPSEGQVITVDRVHGRLVNVDQWIPYTTTRQPDPNVAAGTSRVEQAGALGLRILTYRDTLVNGHVTKHVLIGTNVSVQPTAQVIAYGTWRPVASISYVAQSSGGSGVSGLDWAGLAACESGGNPSAVNWSGPYYGLYQFLLGTWQSVGGSGLPNQASPAEQTYRAQLLYQRSGAGQWPVCGSRLYR
ncbi:MAG: ubiquitin-like domain-containing protein [Actinomycetes bacterium]